MTAERATATPTDLFVDVANPFVPLPERRAATYADAIAQLQDRLGQLNDAAMALEVLPQLSATPALIDPHMAERFDEVGRRERESLLAARGVGILLDDMATRDEIRSLFSEPLDAAKEKRLVEGAIVRTFLHELLSDDADVFIRQADILEDGLDILIQEFDHLGATRHQIGVGLGLEPVGRPLRPFLLNLQEDVSYQISRIVRGAQD